MAKLTHVLDEAILGSDWGPRKLTIQRNGKWVVIDDFHRGKDVKLGGRSPLPAMADGVVVEVADSSVRGGMIAVDHGDGTGHRWHQTAPIGRVAVGTRVKSGQTIALVAKSEEMGTGGKGEHGHLEYRTEGRIRGEVVPLVNTPNPMLYMEDDMAFTADQEKRLLDAADRIMGFLQQRFENNDPKRPARALDTLDGATLRADIQAGVARTVGETSSAFHQLKAIIGGANAEDAKAVATELLGILGPSLAGEVVAELGKQLAPKS